MLLLFNLYTYFDKTLFTEKGLTVEDYKLHILNLFLNIVFYGNIVNFYYDHYVSHMVGSRPGSMKIFLTYTLGKGLVIFKNVSNTHTFKFCRDSRPDKLIIVLLYVICEFKNFDTGNSSIYYCLTNKSEYCTYM